MSAYVNLYRYDLQTKGWWPQAYYNTVPITIYPEEGSGLTTLLMGGLDGNVYDMGQGTSDNGTVIPCDVLTPSLDLNDPRAQKLWMDLMVDIDPAGATLTLTPQMDNLETSLADQTVTGATRQQTPFPLADTSLSLYRNMALEVQWSSGSAAPILYEFEPNALLQPFLVRNMSTQFQSHGYTGFGHLRDGWIVYISTTALTLQITPTDGGPASTSTLTLPSSGGAIAKQYVVLPVIKGQMFRYNLYAPSEFVVFTDETIVRTKEWASNGGFASTRPFAGQTANNLVGV